MKNEQLRNYFLKFWPIIFIFFVWFIFASPYFLKNKAPFPSSYQINNFAPWSANAHFAGPVKNGAMPDIITQIYPWRHLAMEIWKSGQVPLWNPYSFSGTPLLANYQSAVLSPLNIIFFALPFVDGWSILVLLQPLLAGIFMYLLVRTLHRSKIASLVSAVSFMFCGFITVWMGYGTLGYAILFLPLSVFAVEKYYQSNKVVYLILLSLTIPLSFFSGHFQISIYFLLTILAHIVLKFASIRNASKSLYLLLFVFLGLLLSMPQIIPSIEFYFQSVRSITFEKNEVIPWGYIATFLAPDFFGNPVTRNDWFGHYAEWNSYVGILPFMLAVYSVLKNNRKKILLFILSIFVLALTFPTPFQDLLLKLHIPVISTSASSRIIVLFSFILSILCAFGLDQLILDIKNNNKKKIFGLVFGFSVVFIVLWSVVILKLFIPSERIAIAKSNLVLPSIIFIASSLLMVMATLSKKLAYVLIYAFLIVVSFDMLRFAVKWMPFDPKNLVFPDTTTAKSFSGISGYNRTFGNLGGEANVYYKLPSVEGYDALYIKKYGELIGFINNGNSKDLNRSVVLFSKTGRYTPKAISILGIKYIIHKIADDHAVWTFPYWIYPKDQFRLIYKDSMYEFYENTKVFPHVFLVGQYRVERDEDKILSLMFSDNFDLRKEIVLGEDPGIHGTDGGVGSTKIVNYKANSIEISAHVKNKALLLLSENYYPGWKASVDGKEVKILKADYVFRAIAIDKGSHVVKLSYEPWSFKLGVYLGLGGLAGIIFITLISRKTNRLKSAFSLQNEKDR